MGSFDVEERCIWSEWRKLKLTVLRQRVNRIELLLVTDEWNSL